MGKWRHSSTHSLTSALDGGEWSASRPGRFTPRERAPGTHWIGGWVGPRAVLDELIKHLVVIFHRVSGGKSPRNRDLGSRLKSVAIAQVTLLLEMRTGIQ
jgi:hypothetical protein